MANPWRLLLHIRSFTRCETQPPLPYSSLKVQLWDGYSLFVLGNQDLQAVTTLTAASPHHLPLALREVPKKATFHQRTENVNQDTFMLFVMRYLWWQESRPADLLGPFQTSALQDMKLIFFKPAFHYQCLHTHQNNLFTKTHTNK